MGVAAVLGILIYYPTFYKLGSGACAPAQRNLPSLATF
jgi:hypothetical protein